jgi:PAS domain-containing protein
MLKPVVLSPKAMNAADERTRILEASQEIRELLDDSTSKTKRQDFLKAMNTISRDQNRTFSDQFHQDTKKIISQMENLKVIDVNSYVHQIRTDLNATYTILADRNFRQRHPVRMAIEEFENLSQYVVNSGQLERLIDFNVSVKEIKAIVDESRVPDSLKTLVNERLASISQDLQRYESELSSPRIVQSLGTDFLRVLMTEEAHITSLLSAEVDQASGFIIKTRNRFFAYVVIFMALGLFHILAYSKVVGLRILSHQKLRSRFKSQLEEIRTTAAKIETIEENENIIMAIINDQGKILWCTRGFRKTFNSKSARKKGWSFLKAEYLLETNDIGNKMKTYILRSRPEYEIVVTTYEKNTNSDLRVVIVQQAVDYFSDLNRREFSSLSLSKPQVLHKDSHQIIDKLIEESLLIIPSIVQNNNIYLEFSNRIPRTARTNPQIIHDLVTTIFEMCNCGSNVYGQTPIIKIDYDLKDSFLSLSFKFKNVTLDQRALSTPFVSPSLKNNAWEYLTEIESRYEPVRLSVSIKNILEKKNGQEEAWACIQINYMVNLPPVLPREMEIKPLIRPTSHEFNV